MADALRPSDASEDTLGYTITMTLKKTIYLLIIVAFVGTVVILLYPASSGLLKAIRIHAYVYAFSPPKNFTVEDTSKLSPGQAVPILMYHGIISNGPVGPNTSRPNFIAQMEMLKQNGYETISVGEYELFREGKFTLPPKPIILTFDDGRKDSFYPVDDVLKKLGFKATLFVATIRANNNDPFYLGWDELAKMQATGRWEIEAHGRRSHEKVVIDKDGNTGSYLTSRIYTPGVGLESIKSYQKRVEADYINGISDIKEHLGTDPQYLAVPLNHFGALDLSNYDGAKDFNIGLTRRYFKLAFVEAMSDSNGAFESFYNYKDSNPYNELKRLEVKDMGPDNLLRTLEHFAPKPPALTLPSSGDSTSFLQNTQLLYGTLDTRNGFTLLSKAGSNAARVLLGDSGWDNYSIRATIARETGRSASIVARYVDEQNYISLDWGDTSLRLVECVDGKERELASAYSLPRKDEMEITMSVYNGIVAVSFDGKALTNGVSTTLSRGAAGFSVWDPNVVAQSTLKKLEIVSLSAAPLPINAIATADMPSSGVSDSKQSTDVATSSAVAPSPTSTAEIVAVAPSSSPPSSPELPVPNLQIPYTENDFANDGNWRTTWGTMVIDSERFLSTEANASTTGSEVILANSGGWTDYKFSAAVDWVRGQTLGIIARYKDDNNYVRCEFDRSVPGTVSIALEQYINGVEYVLAEGADNNVSDISSAHTIYAQVQGTQGICSFDNHVVLSTTGYTMNPPFSGGIGFTTWDPTTNNSKIIVESADVQNTYQ